MAGNNQGGEGLGDDFFEQMLSVPGFGGAAGGGGSGEVVGFGLGVGGSGGGASDHHHHHQQQLHGSMVLGLGTGDGSGHGLGGVGGYRGMGIPLGLNLDPSSAAGSFLKAEDMSADASASSSSSRLLDGDSLHLTSLFPAFAHMQTQPLRAPPPQVQLQQPFQSQAAPLPSLNAISHPPNIRPRVRARRGQATDPHSIAERQRRERIAERMKALQELVPSCNKTDRAAMLDEIVDYVKFLRLQVKVLSMSRLGGGAVAQLVADVPPPTAEGGEGSMEGGQPVWDRWSNDGTEQQVAKLMEEDVGSAMQFLQSKELCIMPMSLASALFRAHPPDAPNMMKPETNHPQ